MLSSMKLPLQTVDINRFTRYNKADGEVVYIAEMSDFIGFNFFQQLYDDAIDTGFSILNPKTGNSIVVFLSDVIRGPEDQEDGYIFKPTYESLAKFPKLSVGFKVTVFND